MGRSQGLRLPVSGAWKSDMLSLSENLRFEDLRVFELFEVFDKIDVMELMKLRLRGSDS